jgi:hypothetical protein
MKLALAVLACCLAVADQPPGFFVDRGACPFECCQYGAWTVTKATVAYARPDVRSPKVATLTTGTRVTALTGEVHTRPSRFVVTKPHERYRPGDVLWVYTYLGEGVFTVWFKGEMVEQALGFSPYGGTSGTRCDVPECWGRLDHELRSTWWVNIETADGRVGWSNQAEHFGGKDACG